MFHRARMSTKQNNYKKTNYEYTGKLILCHFVYVYVYISVLNSFLWVSSAIAIPAAEIHVCMGAGKLIGVFLHSVWHKLIEKHRYLFLDINDDVLHRMAMASGSIGNIIYLWDDGNTRYSDNKIIWASIYVTWNMLFSRNSHKKKSQHVLFQHVEWFAIRFCFSTTRRTSIFIVIFKVPFFMIMMY